MEQLADNIKTKSLTEALELLTDQVVEIGSLTLKDLQEKPHLQQNLVHLSEGMGTAAHHLCEVLKRKLKSLNPSCNVDTALNELLLAVHEASLFSLELTEDVNNLEDFQDRIAMLLEEILKLVVLWDREIINSFQQSINSLRKPLIGIRKTQFLHEIVSHYKDFVQQFTKFSNQLSGRVNDLVDRKIQNEFWIHLNCIKKLAASFASVIKNIARYPLSKHSRISKEFIVKELLSFLDEISELLNVQENSETYQHQGGSFLTAIDDVLDRLERSHLEGEEMESRLNLILQHSMTVSKFSTEEDGQQITAYSQRVLAEYRSLQDTLRNLEHSPSDISLAVDILRDFLELLEQKVNHSLLRMMVENLSVGTEHIRGLVKKCSVKDGESVTERSRSDLRNDVQEFDSIMERVLQTCFFALSSTGDLPKVQVIRCALKLLEPLEAEMIPAVYSAYLAPDDKAADCHLQFLWRSFRQQFQHLQSSLDSIADPVAFCHIAEKVLSEYVLALRKDLYSQDAELLERRCRPMASIATRCVKLLEEQDWGKLLADQIYLKEIRLGIRELKGAVQLTLDNISDLSSHRSMLKRAELVLKYLMKCVDTMKQMQDFEEFPSVDETLRNTVAVAPSFLAFPDSVRDLPMDVTDGQLQATQLCQTRLRIGGRTPKHKIQRQLGTEVKAEDMTPFINTTQLWRTRCVTSETIEDNPLHLDSTTEVPPPVEESFDLTNLLEELSTLEGTLHSEFATDLTAKSAMTTPSVACQSMPTPTSASISTPSRLKDLQIVSERLALLRDRNKGQ